MYSPNPLTGQQSSMTLVLVFFTVVLSLGTFTYWAGYETPAGHFTTWYWWRAFLTGIIAITSIPVLMFFIYVARYTPRFSRGGLIFLAMMGAFGMTGVYLFFEILDAVSGCNDQDSFGDFIHPHCANPNYPAETIPKVEWFLTVVGAAVVCGAQFLIAQYANRVQCQGMVQGNLESQGYGVQAAIGEQHCMKKGEGRDKEMKMKYQ